MKVDLSPGTPFPHVKEFLGKHLPGHRHVRLDFSKAGARSGQISLYGDIESRLVIYYKSYSDGGRQSFQHDMNHLKDLLVETGTFEMSRCSVYFSSCCDDLIPVAIHMFYSASVRIHRSKLYLSETFGAAEPLVMVKILEAWRATEASCDILLQDLSRHRRVLETIFDNPSF